MADMRKPALDDLIGRAEGHNAAVKQIEALKAEVARLTRENAELRGKQQEAEIEMLAGFEARLRMELAYEIFGEIQSRLAQFSHYRIAVVEGIIKMISALKKKYTEGGNGYDE